MASTVGEASRRGAGMKLRPAAGASGGGEERRKYGALGSYMSGNRRWVSARN